MDGEIVFKTRHAVGRRVAIIDDREYVHLVIKPGGDIEPHTLSQPIEFFVLAGEGQACVDGARTEVAMGDLLVIPAGAERSWTNTDEQVLVILGVKSPQVESAS